MGQVKRSYSDPAFGSKNVAKTAYEGHAINGTNAAATTLGSPIAPATTRILVTGFRALNTVIGTQAIAWYYLGGFVQTWDYSTDGETRIIHLTSL